MTVESRLNNLEQEVAAMKALSEERNAREERMEEMLQELIRAEHERRGRETAAKRADDRYQDDRSERNAMIRHFLPTGLFVGVWMAFIWLVERLTQGGGP